jgi:hypothetical protein
VTATRGVLAVLACLLLVVGCGGATEEASPPPATTAEARDAECPGDRVGATRMFTIFGGSKDLHPGAVSSDESRLLLSGLGRRDESLYAAPTVNGWVCVALGPHGGGGCAPELTNGIQFQMLTADCGTKEPTVAYGLVANDVESVRLDMGSTEQEAVVGANGFFAELPAERPPTRSRRSWSCGPTATPSV